MRGLGVPTDPTTTTLGTTKNIVVKRLTYTENTVEYTGHDAESAKEQMTSIDGTGTKIFDVNWADRQQALFQILGFSWRDTVFTVPRIRRYLPEYQPDFTWTDFGGSGAGSLNPWLTASKASSQGKGERGFKTVDVTNVPGEDAETPAKDTPKYKIARITVQYDFLPYDLLPDTSVTLVSFADPAPPYDSAPPAGYSEFPSGTPMGRFIGFERKPAAEYLSIPATVNSKDPNNQTLVWSDNVNPTPPNLTRVGKPFPGNVGYIVGNIDFKFTWYQVPFDAMPNNTIASTIGRVNLRPVTLPGGSPTTALPGQLLLIAVDTHRTGSPYGNRLWNIDYTMRYNPRGHNNFYDFVSGGWFQASKDKHFYGYIKSPGVRFFNPTSSSATFGSSDDPPDGVLLYDSRDYARLFCPE
jgi:hypothetical protein